MMDVFSSFHVVFLLETEEADDESEEDLDDEEVCTTYCIILIHCINLYNIICNKYFITFDTLHYLVQYNL